MQKNRTKFMMNTNLGIISEIFYLTTKMQVKLINEWVNGGTVYEKYRV